MSKRTVILILAVIIVIAACMRIYGLDRQSLWYDEMIEETAFKWQFLSNQSWYHIHPPLHAMLVYFITVIFPGNDFALRMVPFTFGLISVPLLFLLAKRLFNEYIGLIAAFLLAISPFHIWYSQEVRSYALQWMLALVSLIYFQQALERPSRGNFIGYILSTVAGFYTNQLTIFLVSLQIIHLLFYYQKYKTQLFKWISAVSATAIIYSPWIIYNAMIYGYRKSGTPKEIDFNSILYTIYSYCAGFSVGPSLSELHIDHTLAVIKPYFLLIVPIMIFYSIIFLLGLWSLRKNNSQLSLPLLILTVPIIGVIILNQIMPNISYNVRYTGTALFGFLLFIAKGIEWLSCLKHKMTGKILSILAVVVITGFSSYAFANYHFEKKYYKPDFRGAVEYIKNKRMGTDAVLCLIDSGSINRYARGSFWCDEFQLAASDNKDVVNVKLRNLVKGKNRLWLVLSTEWYLENINEVKRSLDTNYDEIEYLRKESNEIANMRIYSYDLTKPPK